MAAQVHGLVEVVPDDDEQPKPGDDDYGVVSPAYEDPPSYDADVGTSGERVCVVAGVGERPSVLV